jgi:outer membrane protein assembly factor BamB
MRHILVALLVAGCSGRAPEVAHVGPEPVEAEPVAERVVERVPSAPVDPFHPYGAIAPPHPYMPVAPVVVANPGITEKWKVTVGLTTFRSTIHFAEGKVVVNSNGEGWKDKNDPLDGVHVLDPKDGSRIVFVQPPGSDEKDANGVALTKDFMVFGTDQDALYKVDWQGKVLWRVDVTGDVEAAPALADLDGDGALDVAVGSEGGFFYMIDGKKGKVLHTLKAGQGSYGASGFIGSAAVWDATGDGVADAFVPCRDDTFRAIDGKSGKLLWKHVGTSGMHGSPIVTDVDADGKMEVVFTESYSDVWCADPKTGSIEWKASLENPAGGIEGLFGALGWYPDAGCVLVSTAWWGSDEGVYCLDGATGKTLWRHHVAKGNVSSGAVVGDVDGKPGAEAVFGTEAGDVVAVDAQGLAVWVQPLGGPIECTPTLADIDGDGLVEVLVGANNGSLYAFDTPGKAPPAIGYHRGDGRNTGVLP